MPPAPAPVSRLKYMSELMLLLPWNLTRSNVTTGSRSSKTRHCYLDKLASFSLLDSPPKNMSELMDLALPNLFTASAPVLETEDTGAGDLLGLKQIINLDFFRNEETYLLSKSLSQFEDLDDGSLEMFSFKSCSQEGLLLFMLLGAQMSSTLDLELPHPRSSFSTTSKSSKKLSFVLD